MKRLPLLGIKTLVLERRNCSFEHGTAKKTKGKGNRSTSLVEPNNSAERRNTERQVEVHQERKIILRVSLDIDTGGMDFCVVRFAPDTYLTVQTRSIGPSLCVSLEGVGVGVTRHAYHVVRFCRKKPQQCRCVFLEGVVWCRVICIPPETDSARKGNEQSLCLQLLWTKHACLFKASVCRPSRPRTELTSGLSLS